MAIGEAGSITTNSPTENQPITVTFSEALTDPVIALTATNNGGDQFVLRVIDQTLDANGDTTAFTFIIEEWEYHNGSHNATETVNWLAIEKGVHTLPDGRTIEAGTSTISSTGQNTGGTASFAGGFTDPPVVLTSVMSENDTTTVDSDPSNITATGFDLTLQEEEAQDGVHAAETIGWIAIEEGGDATSGTASTNTGLDERVDTIDLNASFTNSVVLGETQTLNGPDTATVVIDSQSNSTVDVFLEEEQSDDPETNHINETVGIVAFENGLITCFTPGTRIRTPLGTSNIEDLKVGDWVDTVDSCKQQIRWIGRRALHGPDLAARPELLPIRITAHALGASLPARDLIVSRQHRMVVSSPIAQRMFGRSEVLVAAIKLTALPGIYVDHSAQRVDYIHLLFDDHQLIYAEDAVTESLYLGPQAHKAMSPAARDEIRLLFPELAVTGPAAARFIPPGRLQKKLVERHLKNRKPVFH